MTAAANLFAQQEANRKASRRLVAGFVIFVAWLGFGGDQVFGVGRGERTRVHRRIGWRSTSLARGVTTCWIASRLWPKGLLIRRWHRSVAITGCRWCDSLLAYYH